MSETSAVTVRIAGEEHVIRANVEPEHTRRCARFVDQRITEIRERGGLIDASRAAILAALSVTDELFRAKAELERLQTELSARAGELVTRLEAARVRDPGGPAPGA